MNNFNQLIMELMNKIAREGITTETTEMTKILLSSILDSGEFPESLNSFLVFISFYKIKGILKIYVDELKSKSVRISLGSEWMHGNVINHYPLRHMNKELTIKQENVTVYEDGYVTIESLSSIQNSDEDKSNWIFNDYGKLALK